MAVDHDRGKSCPKSTPYDIPPRRGFNCRKFYQEHSPAHGGFTTYEEKRQWRNEEACIRFHQEVSL